MKDESLNNYTEPEDNLVTPEKVSICVVTESSGSDNQKMKDLYRKIVQKTHPDKVKSDALNEFYVRATEANKRGDILTIYAVSSELGIKFEMSDEEIEILRVQINTIKLQQLNFERSHFWVWANSKMKNKKNEVIKHFLFHNAPSVKVLFST